MADNVAITAGSGTTIAADDIGGVKHQRVKLSLGADGTAADADVGAGTGGAATQRVILDSAQVATQQTTAQAMAAGYSLVALASDSGAFGNVAHDAVDAGNPVKVGMRALAHGTNPTAVAAADRTDWLASRAGIPWVIGGHPNVITRDNYIQASDGAQTNAALVSVSAGSKIVVTQISVTCDAANTVNCAIRIGFGTASVPAASLAGTAKILINGKFAAGGGIQKGTGAGIVGIGADDEDLRITCDSPTSGAIYVTYSYYTIES